MRFQPISDSIWIKMTPISCREIKDRPENKEANKRHLFTWHMMITSETKKGYLSMLNVFPPGNLPAGFFSPPNYVFLCSGISLMDSGLRIHSWTFLSKEADRLNLPSKILLRLFSTHRKYTKCKFTRNVLKSSCTCELDEGVISWYNLIHLLHSNHSESANLIDLTFARMSITDTLGYA